ARGGARAVPPHDPGGLPAEWRDHPGLPSRLHPLCGATLRGHGHERGAGPGRSPGRRGARRDHAALGDLCGGGCPGRRIQVCAGELTERLRREAPSSRISNPAVSFPGPFTRGVLVTDRRKFLGLVGAGAALPFLPELAGAEVPRAASADWDMTWLGSVTGKHRAVFDTPGLDSGIPLLRACIWGPQWREVYGSGETTSAVLVLRAGGFAYAMDDATWDRFELAKETGLKLFHGASATPGNPVRAARTDVPERFRGF